MTAHIFIFFFLSLSYHLVSSNNKINVTIFAITNLDDIGGTSAVGGQWLAIQEINNNTDLLSNYSLNLEVFNVHDDSQKALIAALDIISYKSTTSHIYFPIVLGAPWSSLSTSSASVLGAFGMGLISAGATSIALSDTGKYPYFYRTIPSDALQAEGLIILCNAFNWTSIAVVYINDAYGLFLSLGIQELAKKYDIDATSVAVSYEDELTYNYAAKQIKDIGVYIIILVIHSTATLFLEFEREGIVGYPYFYLGVDGWFDTITLSNWNITTKAKGFIGTVPWQTHSLQLDEYTDNGIKTIVNESMIKSEKLLNKWTYLYNNGYSEQLYVNEPGITMIYGYDAMYTIAYAMQEIEIDTNDFIELATQNDSMLMEMLDNIITETIDFVGTSGHIVYDEVGDRINGLYSFGNIVNNGSIDYFGYFYQDSYGNISSSVDFSNIIWPQYFTEKGITPRSNVLTYSSIVSINKNISYTMFVFLGLSLLIAFIFIFLLIYYHSHRIIRAASWRLNIMMCIGAILVYISAILYNIDESFEKDIESLNILCNIRVWLLVISYTILFMPLFVKTYRLSRLFKAVLTKKVFRDSKLFIGIVICIAIDILLLTIFTSINASKRKYVDSSLDIIDELQQMRYFFGICSFGDDWTIYGIISFWKLCELIFGLYVALDVSRIKDITNVLTKFDETGIQLLSILITFIIIIIALPIFAFGPVDNPNIFCIIISLSILLIGNSVLSLNLSPRIYAIITKNEQKYELSPIQRIENKIKSQIKRFSVVEPDSHSSSPRNMKKHHEMSTI